MAGSASEMKATKQRAVVCGGGVIGACTAFYLGQKGVNVTVVERVEVACAASGKAGGFLARDWCSGPVDELAQLSYRLHQEMAAELGSLYGYRPVHTLSVQVQEQEKEGEEGKGKEGRRGGRKAGQGMPDWMDGLVRGARVIGSPSDTAQLHPRLFTRTVLSEAERRFGVRVVKGEVQDIVVGNAVSSGTGSRQWVEGDEGEGQSDGREGQAHEGGGERGEERVRAVVVDGELLPADVAVVAMGPWSSRLRVVSEVTSVSGLKANSIVVRPNTSDSSGSGVPLSVNEGGGDASSTTTTTASTSNNAIITNHMLFTRFIDNQGSVSEPEVYPRPNNEVYVCGATDHEAAVPDSPADIQPSAGATERLIRVAASVSSLLHPSQSTVEAQQACFLPCSADGLPVIGALPGCPGAYIATGHSCWGILNSLATGLCVAELIVEGQAKSVDISPFHPGRFIAEGGRRRTVKV